MGRKRTLHKQNPNRRKYLLFLRENNSLKEYTDSLGNVMVINPLKRLLLKKPYNNPELTAYIKRMSNDILKEKEKSLEVEKID